MTGTTTETSDPSSRSRHLPVRTAEDGRWRDDSLATRLRSGLPLLLAWTQKEYGARYRQSALGLAWGVAQPLATLAAFGFVISGVLHASSDGLPYASFAYAGLAPWSFFSNSVVFGTTSLINATPVLGKVYFPREVVPLAQVATFGIDLGISTALLLIFAVAQGVGISITVVALLPVFLVLALFTSAVATFMGAATVFIRDLRYVAPLAMQMLFIVSPVMYSSRLLPHDARWLNSVNPIAVITRATRACALHHQWPDWGLLGLHGVASAALLVAVICYVRSVEPRLADVA